MDTTALMKMDKNQMLARIGQAKFPKDLTSAERQMMAEVSISYGLDPIMQELMIYQGNPYLTINARYRKAQETGKFDGLDSRPATVEERKERHANEGDYLYRAEAWVKGASHAFVGWGRVRAIETQGNPNLPIVKDPDRQAEKRAEAMALRKGFSMPVPFRSFEELQEEIAETADGRQVSTKTGEIFEGTVVQEETIIKAPENLLTPESEIEPGIEATVADPNRKVNKDELANLTALLTEYKIDGKTLGQFITARKWGVELWGDLILPQYNELCKAITSGELK